MIGAYFEYHGKFLIYDRKSLYLFGQMNQFRRTIVWLVESKAFENFILSSILVNSILLACYDYKDRESVTPINQAISYIG